MKTKNKLTVLRTVYPPISSSLASALKKDKEVEEYLRRSDFYMIGVRAEARMRNFTMVNGGKSLVFDFIISGRPAAPVTIDIYELPGVAAYAGDKFQLQLDNAGTGFKIWTGEPHA